MEICRNCKWYEPEKWDDVRGNYTENFGECMHPNTSVSVIDKSDNNSSVMLRVEVFEYYHCPKYEKKA